MSVFVIPPLYHAMGTWPSGPEMDTICKTEMLRDAVTPYVHLTGLVMSGFLVMFFGGLLPSTWHFDRLIAFFVGQSVFGFVIFIPLYLVPTIPEPEDEVKSSDRPKKIHRKKPKWN